MSLVNGSVTAAYTDLATYDEIERFLYGGGDAVSYFQVEITKSTWFTQVPTRLSRVNGNTNFNDEFSVKIMRHADYLTYVWIRLTLPAVTAAANKHVRWCRNVGHNLIERCNLSFNDLPVTKFDNFFLDFWSEFTIPQSKRDGYRRMIGDIVSLTAPTVTANTANTLPETVLNIPLPLFFTRDTGVALPTAAITFNEMTINLKFRNYLDLLISYPWANVLASDDELADPLSGATVATFAPRACLSTDITAVPALTNVQVFGNYILVSTPERRRMGCTPRDILIDQVQTLQLQTLSPTTNSSPTIDIRFSHNISCMFFAVQNTTNTSERSNYTSSEYGLSDANVVNFTPAGSVDPISSLALFYESDRRLGMYADYYSYIQPFHHAVRIPDTLGYHMYSFAHNINSINPCGGTNFGKLSHVSMEVTLGATTIANASSPAGATTVSAARIAGYSRAQTYGFTVVVLNKNIFRVSGGTVGFPVL